jgi:hypothetical protein
LRPAFLEVALARVADELAAVDAQDIAIDYNSETRQVRFAVTVESDDPQDAVVQGSAIIRTALHAAGRVPNKEIDEKAKVYEAKRARRPKGA